jgi:hypothetical protein
LAEAGIKVPRTKRPPPQPTEKAKRRKTRPPSYYPPTAWPTANAEARRRKCRLWRITGDSHLGRCWYVGEKLPTRVRDATRAVVEEVEVRR